MSSVDRHGPADPYRSAPTPRGPGRPGVGGILLGIKLLAAFLSLAIVVGSGVAWALYRDFSSNVQTVRLEGPTDADGNPVKDVDGKDLNILLVGDDSREGATDAELAELGTTGEGSFENTDTIMVMHVPADGREASVMSFPRDTWVDIPGHDVGKINSAYNYGKQDAGDADEGGVKLLSQVIFNITGLKIDHFIKIGMLGFLRVSNALDGVDLCLNEAQNLSTDSTAEHPEPYTGINLDKGWNYGVKGHQAIAFVRQRHGVEGEDIGRIVRQQYFLSAAFRKIESQGTLLNPFKLRDLLTAVSSSLTVDDGLEGTGLLKLATQMSALTAGNLVFATVPNDGGRLHEDSGVDYVSLDEAAMPEFVATFIGQPDAFGDAQPADPSKVSVRVVNDTNGDDAGDDAIAALRQLGFTAQAQPSPSVSDTTSIRYPDGMESEAKALAAAVPGAKLVRTGDVSQVTLVLGNDGVAVSDGTGGSSGSGGSGGSSGSGGVGSDSDGTAPDESVRHADSADCVN
jgi:LCP family protein required for cell wall assembly